MTLEQFTDQLAAEAFETGDHDLVAKLLGSKDDAWIAERYAQYMEGK